jgi:dTDP-4-amino-4,6-dideoxygalactose transaminase
LETPWIPPGIRFNYQSYAVRITEAFPMTRNALMQHLLDSGISTRRGIMNAHQEPAYSEFATRGLAESEAARDCVILLPMYDSLTNEQQDQVILEVTAASQSKCLMGVSV